MEKAVHKLSCLECNLQFLLLGTMLATVLGQRLSPILNYLTPCLAPLRDSPLTDELICAFVAAVLEFFPAFGLGWMFWMLRTASPYGDRELPPNNLHVVFLSLFGITVGYAFTSKWLIPVWGTLPTIAITLVVLLISLAWIAFRTLRRGPQGLISLVAGCIIVAGMGGGLGGGYSYGKTEFSGAKLQPQFFKVGAVADVRVVRNATERLLQLDGISIGGTGSEFSSEVALALFPRFLRPSARRVLVLGFATGSVCGVSLLFPDTEVICAESEPIVVSAAQAFEDINHRPEKSPRLKFRFQDPRSAVKSESNKFDLMLINYNEGRSPDTQRLLTKQFYRDASSTLTPGGIFAHRLKLDSFSPAGLAMIARTVLAAFPHCGLIRVSDSDCIVLGSNNVLEQSAGSVQAAQRLVDSVPSVGNNLVAYFGQENVASLLFAHLWLNEDGLRRLALRDYETTLISDWNCHLAPLFAENSVFGSEDSTLATRLVYDCASLAGFKDNFTICGCAKQDAGLCHGIGFTFACNGQLAEAIRVTEWGLHLDPDQPELLADRLIWTNEEDTKAINETILRIATRSVAAANRVGVSLSQRKRYKQAAIVFEHLGQLSPFSATVWRNLAVNYQSLGEAERAKECFARAFCLEPTSHLDSAMSIEKASP